MIERLRRWRTDRIMSRAMRDGERIEGAANMRSKMIEMAQGSHDLKAVVTPGTPMFEALPEILEGLAPDAKAQIILAMDPNVEPDEKTMEILKRINSIIQTRNGPELDAFAEDDPELDQLDLQLQGDPVFDYLAVFIQDPKIADIYWYRKVGIQRGSMKPEGLDHEIPYVDLKKVAMGAFDQNPVPSHFLTNAIRNMTMMESELGRHKDPTIRAMQSVIGVAKYTGQKEMSVEGVLRLAAIKYSKMQTPPSTSASVNPKN